MKGRTKLILISVIIVVIAFVTLPLWGMGPAVFLDSKRTIISRVVSPDGKRTAQVERIVVGGVPSIVVMVRPSWMPDWYLAGCAAASHYQDTMAHIRWVSNKAIEIGYSSDRLDWETSASPFHTDPCENLMVTFHRDRL